MPSFLPKSAAASLNVQQDAKVRRLGDRVDFLQQVYEPLVSQLDMPPRRPLFAPSFIAPATSASAKAAHPLELIGAFRLGAVVAFRRITYPCR
jgi:hypothetical protein